MGATSVAIFAYYYYTQSEGAKSVDINAKRHEEDVRAKMREAAEAAKARGDDAYRKGQLRYDDAKVRPLLRNSTTVR